MDYYTRAFLALGLRVIVPDLPGHGRSPGPFTPARAESCSAALLTDLLRRGEIAPARTILAGHSLGAALALRLASRTPVAGVLALSPAPMLAVPGISPEMLLYPPPAKLPPNFLLVSGALEPDSLLRATAQLLAQIPGPPGERRIVPTASHVSLLLDSQALRLSLDWTARLLALPAAPALPTRSPFLAFLLGLSGLALLSGPFLRATLSSLPEAAQPAAAHSSPAHTFLAMAAASLCAIGLLTFGVPLRFLRLYDGGYLVSFLFLVAMALLLARLPQLPSFLRLPPRIAARASALGLALSLLFFAWFHCTVTTAWLDPARLWRWPLLVLALLPFCAAEELLLGPAAPENPASRLRRLLLALAARFVAWLALVAALFFLHNAQVLLVLMAPYFAAFTLLHRGGVDLFRTESRSPAGAALFGAILAAAFCLLLFPLT
ncbi:MAG: hypothetical protein LAN84_01545 [Acidobacteriia bacterium]|nr:hypothetical protein [Terriglobia bacterium]